MADASLDGWKPLAEVSVAEGVPERTLYNWVRAKRLAARKADGVTLVDPAAVRALVAARAAAKAPASAGNTAGGSNGMATGTLRAAENDGELAARVFAALQAGKSPTEIVLEMELPPLVVRNLTRQWSELREVRRSGEPTVSDRLAALEQDLGVLGALFHEATFSGMIGDTVRRLQADLGALINRVSELPVPARSEFACPCGSVGLLEVPIRCTSCHREAAWGFRPTQ